MEVVAVLTISTAIEEAARCILPHPGCVRGSLSTTIKEGKLVEKRRTKWR